jgi:hypothetical protein
LSVLIDLNYRNVDASDEDIIAACESVRTRGFVNYFGLQRFGTGSVPTHRVGQALLKGDFKGAIDLILQSGLDGNENCPIKQQQQQQQQQQQHKNYIFWVFGLNGGSHFICKQRKIQPLKRVDIGTKLMMQKERCNDSLKELLSLNVLCLVHCISTVRSSIALPSKHSHATCAYSMYTVTNRGYGT